MPIMLQRISLASVFFGVVTSWCTGFQFAPSLRRTSNHFVRKQPTPELSTPHVKLPSRSSYLLGGQRDDNVEYDEPSSLQRRILMTSTFAAALFPLTLDSANAAENAAEAIRIISSKTIPGLGPPDVYYPAYFCGKWKVTRIITNSDDNLWRGINFPVKVEHEMRFVPYDAFGSEDGANPNNVPAIADRIFNERSYYGALCEAFNAASPNSLPSIQTSDWTPTNPNVLSLSYANGSTKEIKVTKRSSDVSKDGSSVFSSEFRRVTTVPAVNNSVGGIPTIYASRLLSKWKQASFTEGSGNGSVDLIEGIEILYNEVGTLGERDPARPTMYRQNDSNDLSDWRSTKTKILMERISG